MDAQTAGKFDLKRRNDVAVITTTIVTTFLKLSNILRVVKN